jgi:hypothetical protein
MGPIAQFNPNQLDNGSQYEKLRWLDIHTGDRDMLA